MCRRTMSARRQSNDGNTSNRVCSSTMSNKLKVGRMVSVISCVVCLIRNVSMMASSFYRTTIYEQQRQLHKNLNSDIDSEETGTQQPQGSRGYPNNNSTIPSRDNSHYQVTTTRTRNTSEQSHVEAMRDWKTQMPSTTFVSSQTCPQHPHDNIFEQNATSG